MGTHRDSGVSNGGVMNEHSHRLLKRREDVTQQGAVMALWGRGVEDKHQAAAVGRDVVASRLLTGRGLLGEDGDWGAVCARSSLVEGNPKDRVIGVRREVINGDVGSTRIFGLGKVNVV